MTVRLLDLFCGAGGAATGYHRAGFDVVGVDIKPQPRYPFEFVQADAMDILDRGSWWGMFAAVHASPPCQRYANVTAWRGDPSSHPDLLLPVLLALKAQDAPWVVENVPEAIPTPDLMLCGSMFGLKIRRHRHFLTSFPVFSMLHPCMHHDLRAFEHKQERAYADAMGCTWMNKDEAREAIPPAYTEHIGRQLLAHLEAAA